MRAEPPVRLPRNDQYSARVGRAAGIFSRSAHHEISRVSPHKLLPAQGPPELVRLFGLTRNVSRVLRDALAHARQPMSSPEKDSCAASRDTVVAVISWGAYRQVAVPVSVEVSGRQRTSEVTIICELSRNVGSGKVDVSGWLQPSLAACKNAYSAVEL